MAVIAGPIQTAYQTPDYSPVIEANRLAGMQQQQIMQGAVGQVTDYFKQQGEKKKLIKQSDVQIDAALKLFPDLAPTLQGVRDQIRDENVPLNDRAAVAESVAGLVNMGISTMRDQSNQILEQQKLRQNAEYQSQQLQIAQQNANSRAASAMEAGQRPPKTLEVPVEGGTQTMQWDANSGSYIPIQVSGLGGVAQGASGLSNLPDPLKPYASDFEDAGARHNVPPALLAAIAMHETGNGKSSAFRNKNNAMGIFNASGPVQMESVAASIEKMAGLLGRGINEGRGPYANAKSIADIASVYAPPGAGNDPRNLNQFWTKGVASNIEKLIQQPEAAPAAQPQPGVGFRPSTSKAVERGLTEEERIANNLPAGANYLGKFEGDKLVNVTPVAQPQPPRVDPRTRDLQMYEEARKAYLAGDDARAIDLLSTLRANGLFGGAVTITDLPERFGPREEPPAAESSAPAPAATPSLDPERKAQIDAFFPNR